MPADQAQQFDVIGVRGIVGMFFEQLERYDGMSWISDLCNTFQSNQDLETYAGLGNVPRMREWIGSKQPKGFDEFSVKITNRDWESTLRVKNKDRRRDKTGQLAARIGELAESAILHDVEVISAIIDGGGSTAITLPNGSAATVVAFDGQPLFSDSHLLGKQALDNNLTFDLSDFNTATGLASGGATTPTPAAFASALQAAIQAMYGFKDSTGRPSNAMARKFICMVPPSLSGSANQAVKGQYLALGYSNPLPNLTSASEEEVNIRIVPNPWLTWTDKFALFRADGMGFKPIIRQVEAVEPMPGMSFGLNDGLPAGFGVQMKVLAEGSDNEFYNNEALFSLEKSGMVGLGKFDQALLSQFVA
jgi:phage major head subunit gpT-like protein